MCRFVVVVKRMYVLIVAIVLVNVCGCNTQFAYKVHNYFILKNYIEAQVANVCIVRKLQMCCMAYPTLRLKNPLCCQLHEQRPLSRHRLYDRTVVHQLLTPIGLLPPRLIIRIRQQHIRRVEICAIKNARATQKNYKITSEVDFEFDRRHKQLIIISAKIDFLVINNLVVVEYVSGGSLELFCVQNRIYWW